MTKKEKYRPRIADRLLERKLRGKGAVLLEEAVVSDGSYGNGQLCLLS